MERRLAEGPGTARVILQAAGKIPPCEAPAPCCLCWVGAEPGAVMQCCLLSPLLTARWEAPGFLRPSWCQWLSFPPAIPLLFPIAVMPGAVSLGEFPLLCILASCHLLAAAMDELPPCCTACHCKARFLHSSLLSPILHSLLDIPQPAKHMGPLQLLLSPISVQWRSYLLLFHHTLHCRPPSILPSPYAFPSSGSAFILPSFSSTFHHPYCWLLLFSKRVR